MRPNSEPHSIKVLILKPDLHSQLLQFHCAHMLSLYFTGFENPATFNNINKILK